MADSLFFNKKKKSLKASHLYLLQKPLREKDLLSISLLLGKKKKFLGKKGWGGGFFFLRLGNFSLFAA